MTKPISPNFSRRMLSISILVLSFVIISTEGRIQHLELENDERPSIDITTFGFYKGGRMEVKVHNLYVTPGRMDNGDDPAVNPVGFTVDRTLNDGINPYSHNLENTCPMRTTQSNEESWSSITFTLDFKNSKVNVDCSTELKSNVQVLKSLTQVPDQTWKRKQQMTEVGNIGTIQRRKREETSESKPKVDEGGTVSEDVSSFGNSMNGPSQPGSDQSAQKSKPDPPAKDVSADSPSGETKAQTNSEDNFVDPALVKDASDKSRDFKNGVSCDKNSLLMNKTDLQDGTVSYSFTFVVYVAGEDCEGLYNLYFHNCQRSGVTLNMSIVSENQESDGKNYLSAGEMPLPALYFMMSVLFFTAGCFWVVILRKSRRETGVSVFKIHYLMGALVFAKSLSLFFRSMNFHYIQIYGTHVEGWAVLYYVTHLLKGFLLFITILLIGTGYAFVKHLLSDKEKKLFMFVIPLQVLANVAQIIIEESEEGQIRHTTWTNIFIFVDLVCCGAILLPVVWSIRHLQEASQTDGKAAMNLRKLKLFRHFYIMVVCYIYFTRIVVQMLLRITVPFQYEWLDDMFREMTTFIFFVLTGYKFRPAANNPYLELALDTDEEAGISLTESGLTEGISKRGFKPKKKTLKEIVLFDPNEDDSDGDEDVLLEKREASHDFD